MLLNAALVFVGSILAAAGSWPAIKFVKEGPPDLLPANPKPIYYSSLSIMGVYLVALIAGFFSAKIAWWVPLVCFFIAGPMGMDLGVKYIIKHGHFLTLLTLGLLGVVTLISAFFV